MRIGSVSRTRLRAWALLIAALVIAAVAASAALAAKPRPVKGANYSGVTTEHNPVSFRISANGKAILRLSTHLGYDGACGQGGGPNYPVSAASIALSAKDTFAHSVHVKIGPDTTTVKISGSFSGKTAKGTIEVAAAKCPASHKLSFFERFSAKPTA